MKTLVIIPTYNERENIGLLIPAIWEQVPDAHILVVDDQSPDGTQEVVRDLITRHPHQLHLLARARKEGLGKAYLAGFRWALERDYEAMVEMDADFSHRPIDLKKMLRALIDHDFVLGSRYVFGGAVRNWNWLRRFISQGGSWYASLILRYPLRDWTGGFNAWKRSVVQALIHTGIFSEGYAFQIELKYKAILLGFHGMEYPILFEDRRVGQSKMSSRIVMEALIQVWRLRLWNKN